MDKTKFRQIVKDHLVPLFSGAELLDDDQMKNNNRATVKLRNIQNIEIKPSKKSDFCAKIRRSQKFAGKSSINVSEYGVATAFVKVLNQIERGIGTDYEGDLLTVVKRKIVAKAVCRDSSQEKTLLSIIDQFEMWSTRLYEGQPISASIGLEPTDGQQDLNLLDYWKDAYSTVPTNGHDTLLVVDYNGYIKKYFALDASETPPSFLPHRMSPIGKWTEDSTGRVAVVLNRAGEIAIVRSGQLVFARRGGIWHFLAYPPLISQMKGVQKAKVREAVLSSCLDASFARTGACVGIMRKRDEKYLRDVAPNEGEEVKDLAIRKGKFLQIATGAKFQELDRRLRQELMAIDGALILGNDGKILEIGAILKIRGGSSGGGRLSAAKELSKYGTGIKVSQDGGIEAYFRKKHNDQPQLTFTVLKA